MNQIQEEQFRGYGVLIEQVVHQNNIILENMRDMSTLVNQIPDIKADVGQLKQDMAIVKFALAETNKEMRRTNRALEKRIVRLEQA